MRVSLFFRRIGETFLVELNRREDIFEADVDAEGAETMARFTNSMKQYRHLFRNYLGDQDGEDDDLVMEEEDLVSKCPISKTPIRMAARTTVPNFN